MRKELTLNELYDGILANKRSVLSRAITLIESFKKSHQQLAEQLIQKCIPHAGNSIRIGITGVPGVGKSTFIEALGKHIIKQNKKLAILAIDPSSQKSGGSILGDKTRMEELAGAEDVFIRPSPSSGALGGVAKATRETIILFEAAGFDAIIVETVGVGQSETTVHSMVDCFILLLLAGAGDELQGIKRGIMEMGDILLINKADGNNLLPAKRAASQVKNAIHLFPTTDSGWTPKVEICSALENFQINEIWDIIEEYQRNTMLSSFFDKKRKKQAVFWMYQTINETLKTSFYNNPSIKKKLIEIEAQLIGNKISSYQAAHLLLNWKE